MPDLIVISNLIVLSSFSTLLWTGGCMALNKCEYDFYYDSPTERCFPCSECRSMHSKFPNCDQCPPECPPGRYHDPNTPDKPCHPCTDCKFPRMVTTLCRNGCTVDEMHGINSTATSSTTTSSPTIPPTSGVDPPPSGVDPPPSGVDPPPSGVDIRIILGVILSVASVMILIVSFIGIYQCKKWKKRHRNRRQEVGQDVAERVELNMAEHDGSDPLQYTSMSGDVDFQGIAQPSSAHNTINYRVNVTNGNGVNAPNAITIPNGNGSCQRVNGVHTSTVDLHEDIESSASNHDTGYAQGTSHSFLGMPVCQPEQDECFRLQPSHVSAADGPHLSLDPNKPNAFGDSYHSGLTGQIPSPAVRGASCHNSFSFDQPQTSLKSSH